MRRRTKAREFAVQFLYQLDLRGAEAGADAMAEVEAFLDAAQDEDRAQADEATRDARAARGQLSNPEPSDRARREPRRDRELRDFALRLITGTRQHQKQLDEILVAVTRNWDLRRMAAIDRNILRMAIYELLYCADIPPKVTINEAIELGKRFSTANSGSFINGILDRVRIDIDKGMIDKGPIDKSPIDKSPIDKHSAAAPARRPLEQGS
jgi:N utilization substance protein B